MCLIIGILWETLGISSENLINKFVLPGDIDIKSYSNAYSRGKLDIDLKIFDEFFKKKYYLFKTFKQLYYKKEIFWIS